MNELSVSKNIEKIESKILAMPQAPMNVVHKFGPRIYMRELTLPKGVLVVGHHQNFEHVNIFLKGRINFVNDEGKIVEMCAPMTFVGKPGRKVAYILEEALWINVYATNETDIEKLEAHFLTKSNTWMNDLKEKQKLLFASPSNEDREDFLAAIKEFGMTEEYVRKISVNMSDMVPLPYGDYKIKPGRSAIEGTGVFATSDIEPNEVIGPARLSGKRTVLGRFTNHSKNPNSEMIKNPLSDICLVSLRKIKGCHGGQDGEEITVDYRQVLKLNLAIGDVKCQQPQQQ